MKERIYRIIDANINRAKEGLRVCEEITRFILDDSENTKRLKRVRHRITEIINSFLVDRIELLAERESSSDVGRESSVTERTRANVQEIFWSNIQRVKESLRVLEEFAKLFDEKASENFKTVRFDVYALEKEILPRINTDGK